MTSLTRVFNPRVLFMCSGGGSPSYTPPKPAPPPPPPTQAPVLQAGGTQATDIKATEARKVGKAKLQIPLGGSSSQTGLGIPVV